MLLLVILFSLRDASVLPDLTRPQAVVAVLRSGGGGGAEEARTPDPLLAKEVLSQLSYGPVAAAVVVVGHSGLEPETSVLSGLRSNQLS